MTRMARSCVQSLLKVVNSAIGMVGIAMILYALWMFRVWHKQMGPSPPPFFGPDAPAPWFIYSTLGLGITLCVVTCSGHIAAETASGCCLYIFDITSAPGIEGRAGKDFLECLCNDYMVFVFLLLMIEAAVTVDVFLNRNWEEDFPEDTTGNFDELKHFLKENFDICKWVGLSVVTVQALSILLAMILKALGPHPERYHYESDDDYIPDRVPLLKNYVPSPSYVVGDPVYGSKNDAWNIRINSKASR